MWAAIRLDKKEACMLIILVFDLEAALTAEIRPLYTLADVDHWFVVRSPYEYRQTLI